MDILINFYNKIKAIFGDSPALDSFARLRTSHPVTLFESKQLHSNLPLFWDDQEVSGSGTTSSWNQDKASTIIGVAGNTAGKRVRQTFMRFNYQPGKSQLIFTTGTLRKSGGGSGISRGWGYYDGNNGISFLCKDGITCVRKTSRVTGLIVNTDIPQFEWNLDKMDGMGPSKIVLDTSKNQIFVIDFEWLGTGRVRIGLVINGLIHYIHQFLHANITQGVYMSTPNLPLRYWIENDGTGEASTLEQVCGTVISEGGVQDLGTDHSRSTQAQFINANTAGQHYAVFGIRTKSNALDAIAKVINVSMMNKTSEDYHWELRLNPTIAGTIDGWTDLGDVTTVLYSFGDVESSHSTTQVTGGHVLDGGYVKSGKDAGAIQRNSISQLYMGAAIDGTRDEIWLVVSPLSNGADIYGGISWKESG